MHPVERLCLRLRHGGWLDRQVWLWKWARPVYDEMLGLVGRGGLPRCINGTDRLRVLPELRGLPETYEPVVWSELVATIREGDTVVDVGAFLGLYTVAAAKRVGGRGRVIAFEPDPANFALLTAQVKLNAVSSTVELVASAVGSKNASVTFSAGKSSQSHVNESTPESASAVSCVRLDTYLVDRRVDLIKVDVEGYEAEVLKGAIGILRDARHAPRALFIEVHPYAWEATKTSDRSLIGLLNDCGYSVHWLDDRPVDSITSLAEIVARRKNDGPVVPTSPVSP